MRAPCLVIFLVSCGVQAQNLLSNPSFEAVDGDRPRFWQLAVQPQEGALGRLDSQIAYEGQRSVVLRNAKPYPKEPANNWSQNLVTDVAGKELELTGYVKTEDATDAAIWVQCWQKSPARVLHLVSSADSTPVRGTMDWTKVQARVKVPPGTDFLVCRCVLKGEGRAWFDSLSLRVVGEDRPASSEAQKEPVKPATKPASNPDDTLRHLRDTNQALVETNRALRETNEVLAEQLKTLQQEMQNLREQIRALQTPPSPPVKPSPPQTPPPVPPSPLVPHGEEQE